MRRIILLVALGVLSSVVYGQIVVRDFQAWPSVQISKSLGKKWEISLENQLRLEHNASQIDENVTELEVDYSPLKRLQFSVGVREIRHHTSSGDYENRMRFQFDTKYTIKADRLDIGLRGRFQTRSDQDEDSLLNDLRAKIQLDYDFQSWKLDPFVFGEVDYRLPGREQTGFNSFRLGGGVYWKISNTHRLKTFYMYEREQQEVAPFNAHRIGIGYQIRF